MHEPGIETESMESTETQITETHTPAAGDGTSETPTGSVQISIDSPTARAPEHVRLPERYRDTEATSLADDQNWSRHLESNWGF